MASTIFSLASTFFVFKKRISSNVKNQCTSKEVCLTIQAMVISASVNRAEILQTVEVVINYYH